MTKLVGLQFSFQYKKGPENKAADALSRIGHVFALRAVSTSQPDWIQEIHSSYDIDTQARQFLQKRAVNPEEEPEYSLDNGLLKHQGRIWVGANAGLQTKIIEALHSSPVGGHSGSLATYQKIKKLFHWAGIKTAVKEFVQQCQICQQAKHENCKYPRLLAPLPIPRGPWEDISMDFIEGLPKSNGSSCIFVVVNRYTKYSHFIPLKHPCTTAQIAHIFLQQVVKLHGMPYTITSDRDKIFTRNFWRELFKLWGTKLQMSTAYHPQTDGQPERVNQCLEMYLRCAVNDTPKQWAAWLPLAEFWYNSSFHSSLGTSPFVALYGHEPRHWGIEAASTCSIPSLKEWLEEPSTCNKSSPSISAEPATS